MVGQHFQVKRSHMIADLLILPQYGSIPTMERLRIPRFVWTIATAPYCNNGCILPQSLFLPIFLYVSRYFVCFTFYFLFFEKNERLQFSLCRLHTFLFYGDFGCRLPFSQVLSAIKWCVMHTMVCLTPISCSCLALHDNIVWMTW